MTLEAHIADSALEGPAGVGTASAVPRTALARLLDPRSIVVVGASANPAKRGFQAIRALQRSGYADPIYPVNPSADRILGLDVFGAIDQVPHGADVALIALPGSAVPDTLRACAAAGIAGAVVLANGFGEIGDSGSRRAAELADVIAETGIRVIGPNTSGVLNATTGANLIGLQDVPAGPVSVITQSGNMLLSLINDDRARSGPGFHICAGLGNQADVRYDECLEELAEYPETRVVAMHSEGFTDGRALLTAAARVVPRTPVVLLRGGRSEAGRRTALSHTGSIAGVDAVADAVLRQAGIEVVDRSDELGVVAGALATCAAVAPGRRVAVLSDGGGHAALACDALAASGVELAVLDDRTSRELRALLGEAAAVGDPVDVAGATDADPMVFAEAVRILMRDPDVGLILIIGLYGGYQLRFDARLAEAEDRAADRLLALSAEHGVPIVIQSSYAGVELANHNRLRAGGVPVIASIDLAVRAVAALDRRERRLTDSGARSTLRLPPPGTVIEGAGPLDEPAARRVLADAGIPLGSWTLSGSAAEAAAAVRAYDRPCAVKVVSPQVIHKSEVGGVRLGVVAGTAVEQIGEIVAAVTAAVPGARIDGFLVTPMADAGVELLVGATRDPIFGPVVAFGSGGLMVEALRDVAFRAAPFTEHEAHEMLEETVASRMLDGYRNLPVVDRRQLAQLLVRVGDLVAAHPEIAELDLNPVIASASAVVPVDVRMVLSDDFAPPDGAVAEPVWRPR
ncbi:acetate--CoA ligase family protein [Nocardia sp. CA2R105]|uniref:acetate--CoA ligase family protein n=1 Tax=Nocardia coffeae TaxID=2873381 RepID=UPI001CA65E4F|nr:acetate--CoA ligase [Nocardia coffeae]MBY8862697.1 acetate--CoA ligase family protein [Nocardia coffeae]